VTKNQMNEALAAAVTEQFMRLFANLISDPSEEGHGRFAKGIDRLATVEKRVREDMTERGLL
jgi:hypothetical protein